MLMIKSLVEGVLGMLNDFPSKQGILATLSPSVIVERKEKLHLSRKMMIFGTFVLIHLGTSKHEAKGRVSDSFKEVQQCWSKLLYESALWETDARI